jgi:NAD(P)-dependent dehydrogenase (short-subunit alcohol dehydrogenase family)
VGFDEQSTASDVVAGHDLRGRNAIVTGGSSGIGLATVRALATAGARVLLTGRDPAKGAAVVAELRAATGNPDIDFEPLELGRLADVDRFWRSFLATGRPLHLLVNNAAVLAPALRHTADGFEQNLGVNHLGHFALTLGLVPALRAAGEARIAVLTSRAHRHSDIDFADPNYAHRAFETWEAYGQSKTANALFAVALTERLAGTGITANAVMPGMVWTGLPREMTPEELAARGWVDEAGNPAPHVGWKTAEQAAASTVWAAVAPELAGVGGRCVENCAVAKPWSDNGKLPAGHYLDYALDADRADRLWVLSETLLSGTLLAGTSGVARDHAE